MKDDAVYAVRGAAMHRYSPGFRASVTPLNVFALDETSCPRKRGG